MDGIVIVLNSQCFERIMETEFCLEGYKIIVSVIVFEIIINKKPF